MKIKTLLIVLMTSVFLMSCDSSSVSSCKREYKSYLKKTLKDPSSLIVYSERITRDDKYHAIIKVDYGAKNSYGAYTRKTSVFQYVGYSFLVDGEIID
ncbi:hypothetical protein [Polaribacter sp. IC073]|uniref:hypothetical protein n=1 Tax=Polaribacter sp. IC073 TaxID=2508540 RepID=UPI0011BF5015|nr:hypothetical protein [Polaribacter sp. IC073]TXD47354.1 hypothetical protein ES045_12210 [Polaribacter sp. IC073]